MEIAKMNREISDEEIKSATSFGSEGGYDSRGSKGSNNQQVDKNSKSKETVKSGAKPNKSGAYGYRKSTT